MVSAMKKAGVSSILIAVMLLTVVVIADAQSQDKVATIGCQRFTVGEPLSRMVA